MPQTRWPTAHDVDLIVSDLDGTFLGSDDRPSDDNVAAMLDAHAKGIAIAFATGRPARFVDLIGEAIRADPHLIMSNGAVIVDAKSRAVTESFPMASDLVSSIVAEVTRAVPQARFGFEFVGGWACEPEYSSLFGEPERAPLAELVARGGVIKLLVTTPDLDTEQLADAATLSLGNQATITWSCLRRPGLLEISAPGVHKGAALARLLTRLRIDPRRVAAFGDMPNDSTMLTMVGHPFVVADAHPTLLAAGFPRVGPHDADGVGQAVRSILAS